MNIITTLNFVKCFKKEHEDEMKYFLCRGKNGAIFTEYAFTFDKYLLGLLTLIHYVFVDVQSLSYVRAAFDSIH